MAEENRNSTPLVLASVQLKRNTATEVVQAKAPLREATLEGYRRRNAVLDAIFYDVGVVTPTTLRAAMSCLRLPELMRSRERSSSQMLTPRAESCSVLVLIAVFFLTPKP